MSAPADPPWPQLVAAFQQLWAEPARAHTLALCDESDEYTYRQLHHAVGGCAGWLRSQGVCPGERVAIAMERTSRLAIVILGVMAAGACPCPLEPMLGEDEARRRTQVATLAWVVVDEAHRQAHAHIGLPERQRLMPGRDVDADPYWHAGLSSTSDGLLLFTSGSSGPPKGVLQNHRGMLSNALGIARHTGLSARDRLLHVMPLHHTNGINNQLLAPLLAGSAVMLASRFKAQDMPGLVERYRPTIVTGVPTMYARMLDLEFSSSALGTLRMLRCGSAPITEELHRRIEAKFGLPLVVSYGLSEATCTSTMNPPHARRIGSVGTPLEGQSVLLRDPRGEFVRGAGVDGEICIAGPSLMTGYLKDGSNGVAEPVGELLRTGDLGRFDTDGYLYIVGRLKDVIIRGGENLSPSLIEEAIAQLPGVAACCVVGKADADLGEVPVAWVVRRNGPAGASLQPGEIADAVGAKLARIYRPAETIFLDALPENGPGKVDRNKLREWVRA